MTSDEHRELRRDVLRLAWPVVLQNFFRTIMFLVDTAMVKELGKGAVAAMGIVGPFMYTMISILNAVGIGTVATVSRAWGAGDAEKQRREAASSIVLSLALGGVVLAAGLFLLPLGVGLFEVPGAPEVVTGATAYIRVVAWCFPLMLVDFAAASILRAAGDTRTPMVVAIFANLLNVFLNWVLIFGHFGFPAMGIVGAATSTAIAMGLQGLITAGFLFTRWSRIRLRFGDLTRVTRESMARLVRVSIPATIEPMVFQSGFLVYTYFVALLGDAAMAAHRSAIAVESISFMPGFGVGVACSAIVGQMLGAKRTDLAETGFREATRLAVAMMSVLAVLFAAIPGVMLWLFVPRDDPAVMASAMTVLRIAALEQPLMGIAFVLAGGLRGAGDTRSPVWIGAAGTWGVRVPMSYLLAHVMGWGLTGVWVTMVMDWAVRATLAWMIVRRGRWKTVRI